MLLCLLLGGACEAIGLGMLVPIISLLQRSESTGSTPLGRAVTDVFARFDMHPGLGVLVIIAIVTFTLKNLLTFAALTYAGVAVANVATRLRTTLLTALFDARWSYFVDRQVGHISNAISNDCTRAGDAYFLAARCVAFAIQAVVYVMVALFVSLKLALTGIVGGVLLIIILGRLIGVGRKAGYRQTDRTSELVVLVSDALNNIKPIKAMDRQDRFAVYFGAKISKLRRALITRAVVQQGLQRGQEIIQVIAIGITVYFASAFWHIPLPELVVAGVIFMQIMSLTGKLQSYLQQAVVLESAFWRTHDLTEQLIANREPDAGTRQPTLEKGCRFDHVSFAHTDKPVVRDASFTVPTGGITVLQGPSGAGKTTLIDLMIGLNRPDSGRVLIDEVPLEEISLGAWRRMIGYVPQELSLLHGSVKEDIALGDESLSTEAIEAALERAGALDFVRSLPQGLDSDVGEMGTRLSGGQRQRLAIARALVHDPALLILDEVTSALDPATENLICEGVAGLAGRYTIIAITHRPAWGALPPISTRSRPAR